jgi:predicted CoA-substrate-specific enzyme activase
LPEVGLLVTAPPPVAICAPQAVFLGIDVGSVTTKVVALTPDREVLAVRYLKTEGRPIRAVQEGLACVERELKEAAGLEGFAVGGCGVTGSGRRLAAAVAGADVVKNEITAHAVAAEWILPGVRTVIEIGGQDSKIIILREGMVADFAMNSICAAGTGSFLDRQAGRLGIPIEAFGDLALRSGNPVRIAGRCAVFAESDMIHKQQTGHGVEDIVRGLCQALVRNYLNNVGKGKDVRPPVVFQGGVAANRGIVRAFEEAFGHEVVVPPHYGVMGALGAAMLAIERADGDGAGAGAGAPTAFRGFGVAVATYRASGFECAGCANACEVVRIHMDEQEVACWGGRCGRWDAGGAARDRRPKTSS